ncbi:acyl carrier protein [Streptomyces ficellus]|uniref:Acyl carrier protein n=1 Tax=Streptomyces ficellus TaxID=1977088 RepID=A0ABT7Z6C4_9ACTN|nr:acyl carrier protein [Streptomyces ficellus]MDN3295052.1 acyl carrier protein [Streptomyces ficellus]
MLNERIHKIWARELNLDDFSDTDDFFELGGHSLIMTRIQAAIQQEIGIEVPMDELFRNATVADISAHLEKTPTAS